VLNSRFPPVYAITDRAASGIDDHTEIARRLFRVGIRLIQVREKEWPDARLLSAVESVAELGRAHRAAVLVNDRVDIARVAGVGAHLGEEDLPPADARRILGTEALLGVSTHGAEAAAGAFAEGIADYVAFGPVFASGTKSERPPRGLEALAEVARMKTRPLVGIGGITAENAQAVFAAGADSVAVIGGLFQGGALEQNARALLDATRRRRAIGRVYLIGFSGAGKTSVGRQIASRLRVPFVDLDAEIERTSGRTIRALFESSGEEEFRRREAAFLEGTSSLSSAVIATGGGCFSREHNREVIGRLGTAVFLRVPWETLLSRLSGKTDRPLFQGPEQARSLYAEREPFYKMAAIHVELAEESIEEAADRVLADLYDRLGG
jgi:thiamine-phosphate pyrophosphorylase